MGVDYYTCSECNRIFADCEVYYACLCCGRDLCHKCKRFVFSIPRICDKKCIEGFSSAEYNSDEELDHFNEICTCMPKITEHRKHFLHDHENFCKRCLIDDKPYGISDRMLLSFLIKKTDFTSIGAARIFCKEFYDYNENE